MCKVCDDAIDAVSDKGEGPTAFAWDRAAAAFDAWRETLPLETEFDDVLAALDAWCDHMSKTKS